MKCSTLIFLFLINITFTTQCNAASLAYVTKIIQGRTDEMYGVLEYWEEIDGPNPCYNDQYKCIYALKVIGSFGSSNPYGYGYALGPFHASHLKTMKEVVTEFKKLYPTPYHFYSYFNKDVLPPDLNICLGMTVESGSDFDSKPLPGILCPRVPPPELTCNISGNNIIDHAVVSSDELSQAKALTTLTLQCNMNANLKLFTRGQNGDDVELNKEETLKSRLKINEEYSSGGVKINVEKNKFTTLVISSEIFKTGEFTPGPFHGSANLIITIE